eukprot:Nitzschia sp. Nitz4//scaffold3_size479765//456684//459593//NITZ4_000191-RA/size479765-augustus-gene-1.631-mRNA-1//-1//CDS//3329551031//7576//frame0
MRGNKTNTNPSGFSRHVQARILLAIACLWPLWIMAMYGASASSRAATTADSASSPLTTSLQRYSLRSALDRVDIMGYGPTHPRLAFVVMGDDTSLVQSSVESIFRHTDLDRVFLICTVLEGLDQDAAFERRLRDIDAGSVPHWHGLRMDIHSGGADHDQEPHGRKIHAMFHPRPLGVAASRMEAVQFVKLLEKKHIDAGLKSPEEDLILVFMHAGVHFADAKWLPAVTNALIVPPPILRGGDEGVALKLANAVSLRIEAPGKVTSFDEKFTPVHVDAKTSDINLSSGASYSTPVVNGAAIAMRLQTYLDLPAQDTSLTSPWAADLDLSLNLWLCADGIDILEDAQVTTVQESLPHALDVESIARVAALWMDRRTQSKFFQTYSKTITRLDWETKMQRAQQSDTFPKGEIARKCRSFDWYIQHVNDQWANVIAQSEWGVAKQPVMAGGTVRKEEAAVVPESKPQPVVEEAPAQKGAVAEKVAGAVQQAGNDGAVAKEAPAQKEAVVEKVAEVVQQAGNDGAVAVAVAQEVQRQEVAVAANNAQVADTTEKVANNEAEVAVEEHALPPPAIEDGRPKPKIPLRPVNLEIVQKAKPVDISFLSVDGGHSEHPHMGAKDEEGNWGYIHDETALRMNPPPFTWDEGQEGPACKSRDNNYKMLTQRVQVEAEYEKRQNESGAKRDKIFCLVYTIESGHPRIPNIRETWGPKCDGFMVGSTKTDKSLGTVEIPHEGPEEYNNIWQKVRSMWSYIYDNYYEKYDWFHIGGDDLFLIVENLRYYLESEEIKTAANGGVFLPLGNETMQTPLLLGRRFAYQGNMEEIFDSGGSGYTMNKAALKLLVTEGFPNYFPHAHTFSEDTMVARLFRKMGVLAYDTKDDEGSERYMPFLPGHHWGYHLPKDKNSDWYAKYSIDIKEGPEHCSKQSLAFHYVKDQMMKRLFGLTYGLCSKEYMSR